MWRPKNLQRAVWRLAGLLATCALLMSIAIGGKRYFFCAGMDRIHGDDPCCAQFEPSIEDRILHAREGDAIDGMALGELEEPCCETRHHGVLPGAVGALERAPIESPWVGIVPAPARLTLYADNTAVVRPRIDTRSDGNETGPPPDSARVTCARLSVFVL